MLRNAYSNMLERALLPLGDRVEGGGFMRWLRQYRQEQWLPGTELRQVAEERLAKLLSFARSAVPFYKNIPCSSAIPSDDIQMFPIVTKADIKKHLDDLLSCPKAGLVSESSSGSSGIQGTVYMDRSAQASQRAMQMLWFEWCGYRVGDRILQTGITPERGLLKGAKDTLLNTTYIPAFELDDASIERILHLLRRRPHRYLFGYASSLYLIAKTAAKLGVSDVKFDHAVSWGDKLFDHYRESIREAFGCETLDTYGCTEGAMIAGQCKEGSYHLSINQCFVEIVDGYGNRVPEGHTGKVVVTRLDNFAMPLIRYYLGDLAALEPEGADKCPCGRESPLLSNIIGRDTDIVLTRSGKRMIVHFFTAIFEHEPGIGQFQVIQRDLDRMEIRYVPGEHFSVDTTRRIETKIREHLHEQFPINWVEVEKILPTKSGKPQIIQSLLSLTANSSH